MQAPLVRGSFVFHFVLLVFALLLTGQPCRGDDETFFDPVKPNEFIYLGVFDGRPVCLWGDGTVASMNLKTGKWENVGKAPVKPFGCQFGRDYDNVLTLGPTGVIAWMEDNPKADADDDYPSQWVFYDLAGGKVLSRAPAFAEVDYEAIRAFSPNGAFFACATQGGFLTCVSTVEGKKLWHVDAAQLVRRGAAAYANPALRVGNDGSCSLRTGTQGWMEVAVTAKGKARTFRYERPEGYRPETVACLRGLWVHWPIRSTVGGYYLPGTAGKATMGKPLNWCPRLLDVADGGKVLLLNLEACAVAMRPDGTVMGFVSMGEHKTAAFADKDGKTVVVCPRRHNDGFIEINDLDARTCRLFKIRKPDPAGGAKGTKEMRE